MNSNFGKAGSQNYDYLKNSFFVFTFNELEYVF